MKLVNAIELYVRDQKLQAVLLANTKEAAECYEEHIINRGRPSWESYEEALLLIYSDSAFSLEALSDEMIEFLRQNREKYRTTVFDRILEGDLL